MQILEKRDNSKKNSEKKSYTQPQLKEIGKVNNITKGSLNPIGIDFGFQAAPSS